MFVCCVCCQVEVSATSWSLVQRRPTDCNASLCVIMKPREQGVHSPRWAVEPEKINDNSTCVINLTIATYELSQLVHGLSRSLHYNTITEVFSVILACILTGPHFCGAPLTWDKIRRKIVFKWLLT
jgi:hypothetical protein